MYGLPLMAEGPIWGNFKTLIEPCQSGWLNNVFWINNLHPTGFDDKCLPWTWFVPCYIQLTLLIPPLLFIGVQELHDAPGAPTHPLRYIIKFRDVAATTRAFHVQARLARSRY